MSFSIAGNYRKSHRSNFGHKAMLAVLSRFFPHRSNRKRDHNSTNSSSTEVKTQSDRENEVHLTQFSTISGRIVVHTAVELHNIDETVTSPHEQTDHFLVPQFTNQARSESLENILGLKKEVPPSSLDIVQHSMSRYVVEEVAEFYQHRPLSPQTDIRILISKNVIIYVLGTNHANNQCKDDVVDIIKKIKPHTVLVELCPLRACGCKKHVNNAFQTAPKFTFKYLRSIISQLGFLPAMIFFTDVFREHVVSEHSLLHYGGEFIAAMTTAQTIQNCRLVLADRPIEITVKRQASAMGNWRGLRVTFQVTLALIFKRYMKRLMLSANRLIFDDPKTYEVLVFERDLYLTYAIQEAAKRLEADDHVARVVAVFGQGHISGIQNYWGKVPSEFIPLILSPDTILDL